MQSHDTHSSPGGRGDGPRGPRGLRDPRAWHRDYPDRRIAGVCASLARNLEVSVSAVRLAFVVLAFVHGIGLLLYAVLWALLPERDGEPALLDRWIRAAKRFLGDSVHDLRSHGDGGRSRRAPGGPR